VRLRLRWLYGDQIVWETRMAPMEETPGPAELARVGRESGMPIAPRPRLPGGPSIHACRVVVGARLRWPDRAAAVLRRLRVLVMAGEPIDDSDTFEIAAEQAGLPVRELAAYCAEPEVESALQSDIARGLSPPSYELPGGVVLHRADDLEAALPVLEQRADPTSVQEVLKWAGMPLATAEVAAVCNRADVRAELERCARFEPVGVDGYWSLA
jgi:hypothetical protein